MKPINQIGKFWAFLKKDTWQSWLVSLILIIIIIKFIFFPGLSFLTSSPLPLVVVESCSMYHESSFDSWWNSNAAYYEAVARILGGASAPFKVLDAGCGSGYGAEILMRASPREFSHEVFGVDVDPDVVPYAALRHRLANFVCADVATLGFRDGFFDV